MSLPPIKYSWLLLLLTFLKINGSSAQESDSIATYNVRFDNPSDSGDLRENRTPPLIKLIRIHEMDIIGTQEGLYTQVENLSKDLGFPYIGEGKGRGANTGEFCAVFYNPDKFQLLDKGTFGLAPGTEKSMNVRETSPDRICSWGKFKTPKGELFYVFNVHDTSPGQNVFKEGEKWLHEKITEINKEHLPCILTGDFNNGKPHPAFPDSKDEGSIHNSNGKLFALRHGASGVFYRYNRDLIPEKRIAPAFVRSSFPLIRGVGHKLNSDKKYPSVHSPLLVRLNLRTQL